MEPFELLGAWSVFEAAERVGLLAALDAGPATTAELAARLGLDARVTGLVMDVLSALGLISWDGARATAMPPLARWAALDTAGMSPKRLWDHLPALLRTGQPLVRMEANAERVTTYRHVVPQLGRMFAGPAREVAARLERAPRRILDVGCGSGVWSLAVAQRFPEAHVTGLDLPGVVEVFLDEAQAAGLAGRVTACPGDIHETTLPTGFDLVVIANVLRIEDEQGAERIVARSARTLAAGGEMLIVDALGGGTPERELSRALYAVSLAARSARGGVHSPHTIRGWLAAAGLTRVETLHLEGIVPASLGVLLARAA